MIMIKRTIIKLNKNYEITAEVQNIGQESLTT